MSEKAQKDEIVPVLKEMKRSIAMLTSNQNTLVKQVHQKINKDLLKKYFLDYRYYNSSIGILCTVYTSVVVLFILY